MIAVRDCFVAAVVVTTSALNRRTVGRVRVVYHDHMLVVMIAVLGMKMTTMHIIDMAVVLDTHMSTVFVVNVAMTGMCCVCHSASLLNMRR